MPIELSDDDDSDDEFLKKLSSVSRASKRRKAMDEAAAKKQRKDKMAELLKNSKINLERENRMNKLCQENNLLIKNEDLDEKENEKNGDGDSNGNDTTHTKESGPSPFQYYEPKDTRETNCLGSRVTLHFSREVSVPSTSAENENDDDAFDFIPHWFGLEEALTDLRTILVADRQKQQNSSSFTPLREDLLRMCESANSSRACRSYLVKALMSKKDKDRAGHIPVNVLRWMMALACGPVRNECVKDTSTVSNDQTNPKTTQKKKGKRKATRQPQDNDNPLLSRRLLMDAQMGAYQTLSQLWSRDLGLPLQEGKEDQIYLLSIKALPRQLRQWFGSSFSFQSGIGNNNKSKDDNNNNDDDKNKKVGVSNSHSALVRFLELWAIALQKQNDGDSAKNNIHLVQFYGQESRAEFRNDVSDAILAVLWAGLHPSFNSSISAENDGNRSIQAIVACLLDRVSGEETFYKNKNGPVDDNVESYTQWTEKVSERLFATWSKSLGPGRKGTDAHEDVHAWLSLARSVTRLVCIGGGEAASLKDFRLVLCRCMLTRAFEPEHEDQEMKNAEDSLEGHAKNDSTERPHDWLSPLLENEIQMMKIPDKIGSSHRWQAMSLAVAGTVKLAGSFLEEEASKCFALMDICTVCFHSGIMELEHEIQKYRLVEKKDEFDEREESPVADEKRVNDKTLEKYALYNALARLEQASEMISGRTKVLIMRNVCFPWSNHMSESMRNYVRSRKDQYAPPSIMNKNPSMKQQSIINSFFQNSTKPSSEGIAN